MAERRMISKSVFGSDRFLRMSEGAQRLYTHMILNADDDGFVNNTYSIMCQLRVGENMMGELMTGGFVISMNPDLYVIRHWCMQNHIQKDRYKETIYRYEKSNLELTEEKIYVHKDELMYGDDDD